MNNHIYTTLFLNTSFPLSPVLFLSLSPSFTLTVVSCKCEIYSLYDHNGMQTDGMWFRERKLWICLAGAQTSMGVRAWNEG